MDASFPPLPRILVTAFLAGGVSALAVVLTLMAVALEDPARQETYKKEADAPTLARWTADLERRTLVSPWTPRAIPSARARMKPERDYSGAYWFGRYNYPVYIIQNGRDIALYTDGVDRQEGGGAWMSIGQGTIDGNRADLIWSCLDITRYTSNGGGATLVFRDGGARLTVNYYHDTMPQKPDVGYAIRITPGMQPPPVRSLRANIETLQPVRRRVSEGPLIITGTVTGYDGQPLGGALVCIKGRGDKAVRTSDDPAHRGRFTLRLDETPQTILICAGREGYHNGQVTLRGFEPLRDVAIRLRRIPLDDSPDYRFVDPTPAPGPEVNHDPMACGNCHAGQYDEWADSRHRRTAQSAVTRAFYIRDYLRAQSTGGADECEPCHVPTRALDNPPAGPSPLLGHGPPPQDSDPAYVQGNSCDFCHKVQRVDRVDADGVRGSLVVSRPDPADSSRPGRIKLVYGGLVDVPFLYMGAAYNPLFKTGFLCAGCHQSVREDGLARIDTFKEWKRWATVSAGESASSTDRAPMEVASTAFGCPDCHMPSVLRKNLPTHAKGKDRARLRPIAGAGFPREPRDHRSHRFMGASADWLRRAVSLVCEPKAERGRLTLTVQLLNVGAGHKVPTGTESKHLVLVAMAEDSDGRAFKQTGGPTIPAHAGRPPEGTPRPDLANNRFGGLPGDVLERVLEGPALGSGLGAGAGSGSGAGSGTVMQSPALVTGVPFWRAVRQRRDTRLSPGEPATRRFDWEIPGDFTGPVTLRVRVLHRRLRAVDLERLGLDDSLGGERPLDIEFHTWTKTLRFNAGAPVKG